MTEKIVDEESLLDDFSDLEISRSAYDKPSVDDIENMLIDINDDPYEDKKERLISYNLEPQRPDLFSEYKPRKAKKKIPINQRPSTAISISPKQFKDEVAGPEDKLETALSKIEKPTNVDQDRERRFQQLRDMLQRMNREEALNNEWQDDEEESEEPVTPEEPASTEEVVATKEVTAPEEKAAVTEEIAAGEKAAVTEEAPVTEEKVTVEEAPKAEEPTEPVKPEEPEKLKKQRSIMIDDFDSPTHKAQELQKDISAGFLDAVPMIIKTGVLKLIQNSAFDFKKSLLVRVGASALYDDAIYKIYDFSDKGIKESLEAESKLKTQILEKLVHDNIGKISDETFRENVKAGILNAIMLGGYEDTPSGKVVYALPIDSSSALKSLMAEYGVKLNDTGVVRASFAGFISLLELEKENEAISTESLRVLDWYFENFNYQKYREEFVKTMNLYIDINDFDFERTALSYSYHRQNNNEQLVFKEIESGDDADTISRLAEAKNITYDKAKNILEDYKTKNNFREQYLQLEKAAFKSKSFKKLGEIYNFEAGTYAKAIKEIKRIRELDSYASFLETEIVMNYLGRRSMRFLLVRFGFNGYNNVVVLRLQDGVQPVLAWRGKTGDDSDGFRDYFKKAEGEIKRHKMMKILDGKFNHEILNSELKWQKVWDFLNWPD